MKVGEYVRILKEAGLHITEETVRKNVAELLYVLSDEELNVLVQHAVKEGDDWLAKVVTGELILRKMRVIR